MTFNDIFKSSFLNNITSISLFDYCRYGDTFRIQKVSTMQGGTDIVVDRYSDITGRKQVRFSCIGRSAKSWTA